MYLAKNIDVLQINIKQGVDEYYLPKNVNWQNRVIDKIVLVINNYENSTTYSPFDGVTPLITDASGLFFDLYSDKEECIARNLYYEQLLYINNHPLMLNCKLSLNLSRLHFATAPQADGCVLLYVFYGGEEVSDYDRPQKSITVKISLQAGEKINLQYIVDNYIYMQSDSVKSVIVFGGADNPVYLTLRDKSGDRVIESVHSDLLLPPTYTQH